MPPISAKNPQQLEFAEKFWLRGLLYRWWNKLVSRQRFRRILPYLVRVRLSKAYHQWVEYYQCLMYFTIVLELVHTTYIGSVQES